MIKRVLSVLFGLLDRSAEGAVAAYERTNGSPSSHREASKFEAVAWLQSAGGNPELALKRFEMSAMTPDNDLEERFYEEVCNWLRLWCRQAGPQSLHYPDGGLAV